MGCVFRMWHDAFILRHIWHPAFVRAISSSDCAIARMKSTVLRLLVASLLASVAALRAPARSPVGGRAVVGRRFVLSAAALLAPPAATAATLSSQLAEATGLAAQLEANQNAPKAVAEKEGNEADKRCDTAGNRIGRALMCGSGTCVS